MLVAQTLDCGIGGSLPIARNGRFRGGGCDGVGGGAWVQLVERVKCFLEGKGKVGDGKEGKGG